MFDLIESKFEQERDNHTYRRIDAEHPISIYLGYNNKGYKSMVITEQGIDVNVASTKIIEATLTKRPDQKLSLEFALVDNKFSNMYYRFCDDIIVSCRNIQNIKAINFIINRWNAWRLMFHNIGNECLSDSMVMGLVGELLFIEKVMEPKYGINRSIKAWVGPLGNPKDFMIDDIWYEIKTTTHSSDRIKISSIEQLDSDKSGLLNIIRIEKTSLEDKLSVNLNRQIDLIKQKIEDTGVLYDFLYKLTNIGYCYNEDYDSKCYKYTSIEKYNVDDKFPRMHRENIPRAVSKIQYEILIPDIQQFREA